MNTALIVKISREGRDGWREGRREGGGWTDGAGWDIETGRLAGRKLWRRKGIELGVMLKGR